MYKRILAFAFLVASGTLIAGHASPADRNARLNDRPTVGSEVKRGQSAAFQCFLPNVGNVGAMVDCVYKSSADNEQSHAATDPFDTGLFFGAWTHAHSAVQTDEK